MIGLLRWLWPLSLLVTACEAGGYVIDPFAVSVDYSKNVPVLLGCTPELSNGCDGGLTVVLDTGTAITVVDPGLPAGTPLSRGHTSLDLKAPVGPPVTRARFTGFTAFVQPLGPLGVDGGDSLTPGVVLGGDLLQKLAMRLDPAAGQLFFFPNIAGANDVLARECAAVVPTGVLGGGDYELAGAQISYPATRLVVGSCLNLDRNPLPGQTTLLRPKGRGADALLVVATGLPVTVLSKSAWDRACAVNADPTLAADDPDRNPDACKTVPGTLHMPGTPPGAGIAVELGTLSWLGFAADEVRDRRGPCMEVWASRMMDLGGCTSDEKPETQCKCFNKNSSNPCKAGASGEVAGPIQVAVVPDSDPLLQGLRDELRPGVADVDGLLGMNVLTPFVTDFDYPGSRLVFRCEDAASSDCWVRPRLQSFAARRSLLGCLGRQNFDPTPTDQLGRD